MNQIEEIYLRNLYHLMGQPSLERFNFSFQLQPSNRYPLVELAGVNFDLDYADKLARFTLSGEQSDLDEVLKLRPSDADFLTWNLSNAYGTRIQMQIQDVLKELRYNPDSRRGTIMLLEADDQATRMVRREHHEKRTEYLCTLALTFFIRHNQLHVQASMRSSDAVKAILHDLYNFSHLQDVMARQLNLKTGSIYWNAVSTHIRPDRLEQAMDIINRNPL